MTKPKKPPSIRVKQTITFPDNPELDDYAIEIVPIATDREISDDAEDAMLILHDQRKLVIYHFYQRAPSWP